MALTMPMVTVLPTPKGLPMARTTSPTSTLSLSARSMVGRFFASILMRAMSVASSLPMTFASYSFFVSSLRATLISSATPTTWKFVMM